jgi:hypothetical protein
MLPQPFYFRTGNNTFVRTSYKHKHIGGIQTSLQHTINSGIPDMFPSSIPNNTITLSSGRFTPYKQDNHAFMVKYPISLCCFMTGYIEKPLKPLVTGKSTKP